MSAAVGGGKSESDEIGLDTGEGKSEMTDEQIEMWKNVLTPSEFATQFGEYL